MWFWASSVSTCCELFTIYIFFIKLLNCTSSVSSAWAILCDFLDVVTVISTIVWQWLTSMMRHGPNIVWSYTWKKSWVTSPDCHSSFLSTKASAEGSQLSVLSFVVVTLMYRCILEFIPHHFLALCHLKGPQGSNILPSAHTTPDSCLCHFAPSSSCLPYTFIFSHNKLISIVQP